MNMQAMMAQARKLQSQLEKSSKEIDETVYTYENENISVECYGTNKVKSIKIKNTDILSDEEMLADIIQVAINDVVDKIKKDKENKIGKYTNGLGGLF